MAAEKKKIEPQKKPEYSKEQLLAADAYCKDRDILQAVLQDNKKYTFEQVDSLLEKFRKGKVK